MKLSDLKVQPQSMELCTGCEYFGKKFKTCVEINCIDLLINNDLIDTGFTKEKPTEGRKDE